VFPDAPVGGATMGCITHFSLSYGRIDLSGTVFGSYRGSPRGRGPPSGRGNGGRTAPLRRIRRDTGNPQDCRIAKNLGCNKVLEETSKIWAVRTSASCRIAIYEALGHAGGQADKLVASIKFARTFLRHRFQYILIYGVEIVRVAALSGGASRLARHDVCARPETKE
jgi:hypothetical protein